VDENVVVGSSPSSADKNSITDFGSLEEIGQKLLKKRGEGSQLLSASARNTEGIVFYRFEFLNPLDKTLPRIGTINRKYLNMICSLFVLYFILFYSELNNKLSCTNYAFQKEGCGRFRLRYHYLLFKLILT
jgi:hypothetical protein